MRRRTVRRALLTTWAAVLAAGLVLAAPSPARADVLERAGAYVSELWRALFGGEKAPPPPPRQPAPSFDDPFGKLPDMGFARLTATVSEGEARVAVEIVRSAAESGSEVRVVTRPGSAQPGKDYRPVDETVAFQEGEARKSVEIAIVDDREHEAEEHFTVELADPKGAGLTEGARRVKVVIRDDDEKPRPPARPLLAFEPPSVVFPSMLEGARDVREILLRNDGPAATVAHVRITGAGPFRVADDRCVGQALPPGASCTVTVEVAADRAGAYAGGLEAEARSPGGVWREAAQLSALVKAPEVTEDPLAARIAALRAQRNAGDGYTGTSRKLPDDDPEKDRYRVKDDDYAYIGITRNYLTLPVNRERIITTDRFIPCVLEDTVNSQVPGFVNCVVERNVYGSDGRFVLIPAGSRAVGKYESLSKTGDTRLNVVWNRFIRPDGGSIAVGDGFQSSDQTGRTGIPGEVDNRFIDRFGGALLLTGLTVGAALAVPQDDAQFASAYESLATNIGQIGTQMLEENLDLTPIVTIAAGTRIVIRPLVDLWLPTVDVLRPVPAQTGAKTPAPRG